MTGRAGDCEPNPECKPSLRHPDDMVCEPRRLRQAVPDAAGEHDARRSGEVDPVPDADEHWLHAVLRAQHPADGFPIALRNLNAR